MKKTMWRSLSYLAAAAMAAPAFGGEYRATSGTAMAVTGDVAIDQSSITFQNGASLVFDGLVGQSLMMGGERVDAAVYSVKVPADPVLLRGNRLCGTGAVTHVAVYGAGDGLTGVSVFSTPDAPADDRQTCASYIYFDGQ